MSNDSEPVGVVVRSVVSFCNQFRFAQLTCEDKMKIKDLPIGTRLGFGFGIVLLLATISSCIGLWRLNEVASSTRAMMQEPLKKERLTEEWYRVTVAGLKRTLAVVKSSDESLGDFFAADVKTSTTRNNEIQKYGKSSANGGVFWLTKSEVYEVYTNYYEENLNE